MGQLHPWSEWWIFEIENGIYLLLNSSRLLRKLFLESEVNMDKNIVKMIREDRNHILWLNITDIFLMKFGDTIGKEVIKAEMEENVIRKFINYGIYLM